MASPLHSAPLDFAVWTYNVAATFLLAVGVSQHVKGIARVFTD